MVSEYSPSTDDVRDAYLDQRDWSTDAATAFDAWIAGVRAAARREGWRECARAIQDGLGAWDALEHYAQEEDRHVDQ